jgi:hypothetical protein
VSDLVCGKKQQQKKKEEYNMPRGREMSKERNGMAGISVASWWKYAKCLLTAYVNILSVS